MDLNRRARRAGLAAIVCAMLLRLYDAGAFRWAAEQLTAPDTAAFLLFLETGRRGNGAGYDFTFLPESAAPAAPSETVPQTESAPPAAQPEAAPQPETAAPSDPTAPSDPSAVRVSYACSLRPDLDALMNAPLTLALSGEAPTVLILHTHTTESYTKAGEDYVETADYRTLDENYNMLSIGAEVARLLEAGGVHTVQDRSLHDYPSYNGSYADARKSIRKYLAQYPTIRLVLDLHRDAADTASGQLRTLASTDGEDCAQLMLVMGSNAGGLKHPNWEENLSLALKLQAALEETSPGITRPTVLRAQRFNQDLSPGCLLVEVGAAGNTHAEALRGAARLAEGILALAELTADR